MAASTGNSKFRFGVFLINQLVTGLNWWGEQKLNKNKGGELNIQCVKITRDHDCLVGLVNFWCALRLNRLERISTDEKTIEAIKLHDARFLTALNHALATQKDKNPAYDAWLFFDTDMKETSYFELSQCRRGTKDVISTLILRSDR